MRWAFLPRLSLVQRRDLLAALALSVLVLAQWAHINHIGGDQSVLSTLTYRGDAQFTAAAVTAARRGEYLPFVSKDLPSLGAPYVANWGDFPTHEDMLIFVVGTFARLVGVFGAINIFYALAALSAALTMFYVARRFHLSRPGAFLAANLYGLSTFLDARTVHHFALTFYFFFPAVVLVAAWLNSRKGLELRSNKMKAAGVVMLTASWSTIYFVYFTAQVMVTAALAALAKFGLKRWRVIAVLGVIGAVGALSMELDSLMYWRREGTNNWAVERDPKGLEMFALKPVNFIAPALGAGTDRLRSLLAERANASAITRGEAPHPYFGAIGIVAWFGLMGVMLVRLARGQAGFPVVWGLMGWLITSLNTVGGLNSITGLLGFTAFRSVNRASILVLTYVLLFLAWAFPRVTRRLPEAGRWVLAVVLSVAGVWEQSIGTVVVGADNGHLAVYESDKALVAAAEQQLPAGAHIFVLPAIDFPEAWDKGTDSYEPFRPYFFAKDFVFSHGDIKGRPNAGFKLETAKLPLPEMFATLRRNGFEAIYINLRPYGGTRALAPFQQAGATVVAVSPLQDSAFLRLP